MKEHWIAIGQIFSRLWLVLLAVFLLAACSPAPAVPEPTVTETATVTAAAPTPTGEQAAPTETPSPQVTSTPAPTPDEWQQAQQLVSTYRNRLDPSSDGYTGLSLALEQTAPNETWCNGLTAAINDFNYVNDTESAQALSSLRETHSCP